jgi:hypothetical protein
MTLFNGKNLNFKVSEETEKILNIFQSLQKFKNLEI